MSIATSDEKNKNIWDGIAAIRMGMRRIKLSNAWIDLQAVKAVHWRTDAEAWLYLGDGRVFPVTGADVATFKAALEREWFDIGPVVNP